MADKDEEELRAVATRVMNIFYVPDFELLETFVEESKSLSGPLKPSADVFESNILSAMRSACIPYTLTYTAALQRRFDQYHTAERIRALKKVSSGKPPGPKLERQAYEIATAQMTEFEKSEEGQQWTRNRVITELAQLAQNEEFLIGAQELLSNTAVMVWGAFESFVADALIVLLNNNPKIASTLLTDEKTKRHFSGRVSIETIEDHGFDVSGSMGTLLFRERGIDSLAVMRDVFRVAFPKQDKLHTTMSNNGLWLLWQRRHLLVHKRGVVDVSYLKRTSDSLPVGSRFTVSGEYLDEVFGLARDSGLEFLRALTATKNG